jgi:hypothetical protein
MGKVLRERKVLAGLGGCWMGAGAQFSSCPAYVRARYLCQRVCVSERASVNKGGVCEASQI